MSRKNRREREAMLAPKEEAAELESSQEMQEELIDFDGWWAMHASKIPRQHHKEIVKADMRGRGLREKETLETFDKALAMYGVKLS